MDHFLAPLLDLVIMDPHLGFRLALVIWVHHHLALVIMDQHHLVLPLVIMDHLLGQVIWDHYLPCLLVCLLAPLLALGIMGHHQRASQLALVTMRMDPCTTLDLERAKQEQVDLHLTSYPTLAPLPTLDLT